MPFKTDTYHVFIASPSDMEEERQAVTEAIHTWNEQHAEAEGVVLLPVKWETHAIPQVVNRPQQAINDQLVAKCDILIGFFWTKLGAPTGVAESGTVEEIDLVAKSGKHCLLYFSDRQIKPSAVNTEQLAALREFKQSTYKRALVGRFSSVDELNSVIRHDLLELIRNIKSAKRVHVVTPQKELQVTQLHHASLAVRDLKRSMRFYGGILGLEEIPRAPFDFDGAWFRLPGGQELHLVQRDLGQMPPHYRLNHIAFRVSNFDRAYDWLQDHWNCIEEYLTLPTAYPQLYLHDPDGNVVEINSGDTITRQKARKNAIRLRA